MDKLAHSFRCPFCFAGDMDAENCRVHLESQHGAKR
jgi:hypothetical protein